MGSLTARTRLRAVGGSLALAAMLTSSPAAAQLIAQADVCDPATRQVDPNRLALYALAKAGVSNYPYRWLANAPRAEGEKRSIEVRLLAADDFCGAKPAVGADGIKQCADDDRDKLGYAIDLVTKGLDAHDFVLPAGLGSRRVLFSDAPPSIACRISTDGSFPKPAPTVIAAPLDFDTLPLRIRGSTDGLQFRRKVDAAFNGVDKASVSFKSDSAAGKDTTKAAIVVAFAVPLKPDVLEFVPYFGFSTDTAKKDGADKDVTTDIVRAGALIDFRTHGTNWAHIFLVRPEYAADRKARSEVVSGTFIYQPLATGLLNDTINFTSKGRPLLTLIPRFDARVVAGGFTKLGTRLPEDSRDFVRVGVQGGFTLYSELKWLPVELTVTNTYLHALQGEPDDLSYLRGVLSLYFDENKYFGIDLGYARGRKDDLTDREQNWTVGFGAKF